MSLRIYGMALAISVVSPCASSREVPARDFPEYLMQSAIDQDGDSPGILDEDYARKLLLTTPGSPYSSMRSVDVSELDASWKEAMGRAGYGADESLDVYARRMGLTKARPRLDVDMRPSYAAYDPFIAAQAIKAAVDEDIFCQSVSYTGFHNSALAANYAVGAQILRDKLYRVPLEKHDEFNLRADVLERFMALEAQDVIDEYDGDYLQRLLKAEITDFRPGVSPSLDVDYLPAQFRVARVAAAYHDQTGYFGGFPCLPSGAHNPAFAGSGMEGDTRALCFVDATDQDTYAWYLGQLKDQMAGIKRYPDNEKESVILKLLMPVAIISEVAGIASFINFTTGIRAWSKGLIRSKPVKNMYHKVNTRMCGV